jgi:uncharacterized protein
MSGEPLGQPDFVPTPETPFVTCWRCGKQTEADRPRCPFCAAALSTAASTGAARRSSDDDATAIWRTLVVFGSMLLISVIFTGALRAGLFFEKGARLTAREFLWATGTLGGVDTALVLLAWAWIPVRFRAARKPLSQRAAAWLVFTFVLVGLFALNCAYHRLLRETTGQRVMEGEILSESALWPAWLVVICLQPALVEELFFRYMALGVMRNFTGPHTAVLVTAAMFAMAHLGVPLSLPMLFVLGLGLGYARVASGGMVLPIVMHFLHNAGILGMIWLGLQ